MKKSRQSLKHRTVSIPHGSVKDAVINCAITGEEEAAARMSAAALTSSTGARPRRSYSLSEADGEDSDHPHYQQYLKSEFARGARRVTLEQKLKQEREIAREEGYNLRAAEEAEERLAYELINAHAQPSETGLSGSPTHVPSSNPRPPYAHQRMDSDTKLLSDWKKLFIRDERRGTIKAPVASTALALQQTAQVWDDEDGNVGHYQADRHVPAPGKITDSASMPPPPVPVARVHSVPPQPSHQPPAFSSSDRARNMIVNKKQYARLDMIGKGGSSKVYRVMSGNNEIFAIKRVALDKTDAETMSGYMNEISLLKRLDGNRRIIRLIDSEVKAGPNGSKGYLMLVMECGEIDLARLLQEQQKEPLDLVWISYYWKQILQAVHVIHEEKIVHSDLKPANFVLVKGQLKLIDFGIANAIANDTTNIHRDHQIGTVNYMSPEAIELPDGMRRLKVGRQSDVWSLGCILYQMVYGRPPFHDLSVVQKMRAIPSESYAINFPEFATPPITGSPPKDLESLKVRVPVEVIEGMKGCLIRNPKERATIPELLAQNWLTLREPAMPPLPPSPPPPAPPQLKDDEAIISPHFMAQLLQHGMGIGNRGEVWSGADLEREAKRLVAELQSVYTR
ncbi:hypothetical protein EW026_g7123 [Hermanssonia centrifuga]|uniref:Protein kinase domain-containing protein n=1 Tax=Hermanssonia centrifuga TaxID=98765 RepID=A0A4S4K8U2_9APHY|nr:hypothetical protein EW026_g7123 [Hermanssonia centrifuga]